MKIQYTFSSYVFENASRLFVDLKKTNTKFFFDVTEMQITY